ncbi:hypothetical protein H0H87_010074 [Tephrocybe sp. NHM501043]|nr:hypothetical protein H0H87_010074 [Tephrocybe sp. NHM501043]
MTDFAPNLASTVTSLSFSVIDGNMVPLSRALMELGPSIQSLDIRFWEDNTQKFEIPLSFPNVHHLELRNFNDQVPVKELINRITANPSTNTLQSLHIPHVNHQYWQLVSDILSINNLGAKLTSIYLYFGQFHQSEALVTKIMDLCLDLVDLTYTFPFPKGQLNRLPPSIRFLRISIGQEEWGVTAIDLLQFLKANKCPKLTTLEVETRDSSQLENPELLSFFKEVGTLIISTRWVHIATSYMTLQFPASFI